MIARIRADLPGAVVAAALLVFLLALLVLRP
jgi:hypothetical protein